MIHPLFNIKNHFFRDKLNSGTCPCCTSEQTVRSFWFYLYAQCTQCKSIFIFPRPGETEYAKRLDDVASVNYDILDYHNNEQQKTTLIQINQIKDIYQDKQARILDFGCGGGRTLHTLAREGFNHIYGYDKSPVMRDVSRKMTEAVILDSEQSVLEHGPYNVIISEDVIEHCLNPEDELFLTNKLLSPGGVFYCRTPTHMGISGKLLGQSWWCAGPADHIQLYTPEALELSLVRHDLTVVKSHQGFIPFYEDWDSKASINRKLFTMAESWVKRNLQKRNISHMSDYIIFICVK